jgi:hypothetical protein
MSALDAALRVHRECKQWLLPKEGWVAGEEEPARASDEQQPCHGGEDVMRLVVADGARDSQSSSSELMVLWGGPANPAFEEEPLTRLRRIRQEMLSRRRSAQGEGEQGDPRVVALRADAARMMTQVMEQEQRLKKLLLRQALGADCNGGSDSDDSGSGSGSEGESVSSVGSEPAGELEPEPEAVAEGPNETASSSGGGDSGSWARWAAQSRRARMDMGNDSNGSAAVVRSAPPPLPGRRGIVDEVRARQLRAEVTEVTADLQRLQVQRQLVVQQLHVVEARAKHLAQMEVLEQRRARRVRRQATSPREKCACSGSSG